MDTQLIEVIRSVHDVPHFYIRELDMLHKLVLGMTAKEYRKAHNISEEFKQHNFVPVEDHYVMTRDGVVALAMWCKVSDEAYIKRFDEVEEHIYYLQSLREMDTQLIEVRSIEKHIIFQKKKFSVRISL